MKINQALFFLLAATVAFNSCKTSVENKTSSGKKADSYELLNIIQNETFTVKTDKPGDPLLAILWKYSPEAYFLVKVTGEYLHGDIKIGNSTVIKQGTKKKNYTGTDGTRKEIILSGTGFFAWIDMNKPFPEQIKDISSAVHEENHKFTNASANFLFSKKIKNGRELFIPSSDGKRLLMINFDAYYLSPGSVLYAMRRHVNFSDTPVFPAGRLESFIPENKKTTRYKLYIGKKSKQSPGAIGMEIGITNLMDEYYSYYWDNQVIYDLYGYYKNEQPQTAQSWQNWTSQVFSTYFAWAEFRYWIVSYLLYASQKEPQIYAMLIQDEHLRKAFTVIDDRFTELIKKIFFRLEKELPEHLKKFNIKVAIKEGTFNDRGNTSRQSFYGIGNISRHMFLNEFSLLVHEMERGEWINMANAFRLTPQHSLPKFEKF